MLQIRLLHIWGGGGEDIYNVDWQYHQYHPTSSLPSLSLRPFHSHIHQDAIRGARWQANLILAEANYWLEFFQFLRLQICSAIHEGCLHPLYYHMQHINDLTCRYFLRPFSNPWWLWWRCWKLAIWLFYFLSASWWSCQGSIIINNSAGLVLGLPPGFTSTHFCSCLEILNVVSQMYLASFVLHFLDMNNIYSHNPK